MKGLRGASEEKPCPDIRVYDSCSAFPNTLWPIAVQSSTYPSLGIGLITFPHEAYSIQKLRYLYHSH